MANSFGDQLLKAGLVSKSQLDKAKKSRHKQQKTAKPRKGAVVESEATEAARRAAAEKQARDRELNRRRKDEAQRKAIQAQVRQLIEANRIARDGGELGYNFQDGTAIRKIFVPVEVRDKLARGLLVIVRFGSGYEVIPAAVAEKIKQRDATCVIAPTATRTEEPENDPYAQYTVPDDLMW